jgi:hypothetical protein
MRAGLLLAAGRGDSLAAGGKGLRDVVGGLRPGERHRLLVPLVDPPAYAVFEVGDAAVRGAAELAVGQLGELAFDLMPIAT